MLRIVLSDNGILTIEHVHELISFKTRSLASLTIPNTTFYSLAAGTSKSAQSISKQQKLIEHSLRRLKRFALCTFGTSGST